MYLKDFVYNGERLSDYNLMVCNFDGSNDTVDIGNNITINKVKSPNSYKYMSTGHSYDDAFITTFQVCKISCKDNVDSVIKEDELNRIIRWLNRKRFCKFKPIYDRHEFSDVYYNASFNIQIIKFGKDVVGLELTLNTDAPFGYIEPVEYHHEFIAENDEFVVFDYSDEVGFLYCDATITCLESGDLRISNELDKNNAVVIRNCKKGEVIQLYGSQKVIKNSDDSDHRTLYNDFNYNFLRVVNSYENNENVFRSNLKCKLTMKYSPIRKAGIVV